MEIKPQKEKVMSYEEKSVGSTPFFKCEACPYMALAVDDIKFHLFTVHPELAKTNGLAENIQINCPGCSSIFDAEETLRTHLRNHHKMGFKDVKKMIKSLVQIALKNAKLKKDVPNNSYPPTVASSAKIPQVIEIVPDSFNMINEQLPKGVAFISVDELHKMSTPNFEKVDPKEVIQEASINIVYTEEVSTPFVNTSNTAVSCNMVQMSNVPPDLISSIHPRMNSAIVTPKDDNLHLDTSKPYKYTPKETDVSPTQLGTLCSVNKCHIRLKDPKTMAYHRKCHHNGQLQCPECLIVFATAEPLHSHLWKTHSIDLELPTCDICGYKTFKRYRLINIHMKCHKKIRAYPCTVCSKAFKNANQLYKHRIIHKKGVSMQCHICKTEFSNQQRLQQHISAVHDKIKPFKCSHCDYSCARKEELKLHIRSHTGDKPYACDQCTYRSGDHNAMRRHKLGHSNESVYKCKYCPYSSIQSTMFAFHMLSSHPDVDSGDVHCCPYCPFKTVNKDKFAVHLSTHTHAAQIEKEVGQRDLTKDKSKSWTIPHSDSVEKTDQESKSENQQGNDPSLTVNSLPIEVYDCDSLPDNMPQPYAKAFRMTPSSETAATFSKDNNSDCVISDGLDVIERHPFPSQLPINPTLHYLSSSLSNPCVNVDSLAPSHSSSIMANLPIRLPPAPIFMRNNITLKAVDKISLPMPKVTGPIITPTQILPVPSSSRSPINEGLPRKKAKISVKSNLILKGPDQVNMFHSQQKMAFKQLENNERYGLGSPVTFNNLITTQFMQLPPEPVLSESPANILSYGQEDSLGGAVPASVGDEPFSFNQQMSVNSLTMLPPVQKIQTNDPSYIKLEGAIKQNTQSPSLESMCTANLLNEQALSVEYKASPPPEDLHKTIGEIKNEVKSDAFYGSAHRIDNPPIDQYLVDNLLTEQYSSHLDLATAAMPDLPGLPGRSDVIEIDDNSDDNKLLSRFDVNYALESLFLMHNDFHFLENDANAEVAGDADRMGGEVPVVAESKEAEDTPSDLELLSCIQGKRDPMMNTSVRPATNKINVKNIELMKN